MVPYAVLACFLRAQCFDVGTVSQALCMGALQTPPYSLPLGLFAVFCLAGAAGTIISAIAGRLADRGRSKRRLVLAHWPGTRALAIGSAASAYLCTQQMATIRDFRQLLLS